MRNDPVSRADADGHDEADKQGGSTDASTTAPTTSNADKTGPAAQQAKAEAAQNHGSDPQPRLSAANWTLTDSFGGNYARMPAAVTYDKNVPAMTEETNQYIEQTATNAGLLSINISATTNGEHAPNSNHYNGTAVDINMVNGGRVRNSSIDPEVARHVGSVQETANDPRNGIAHENYGPAGLWKGGRAINNSTLQAQHENHIHITIPRDDQ